MIQRNLLNILIIILRILRAVNRCPNLFKNCRSHYGFSDYFIFACRYLSMAKQVFLWKFSLVALSTILINRLGINIVYIQGTNSSL